MTTEPKTANSTHLSGDSSGDERDNVHLERLGKKPVLKVSRLFDAAPARLKF